LSIQLSSPKSLLTLLLRRLRRIGCLTRPCEIRSRSTAWSRYGTSFPKRLIVRIFSKKKSTIGRLIKILSSPMKKTIAQFRIKLRLSSRSKILIRETGHPSSLSKRLTERLSMRGLSLFRTVMRNRRPRSLLNRVCRMAM